MMKVQELTGESFKEFGQILTMDEVTPVAAELEFDWYDTAGEIELSPKCCTGILVCRHRKKKIVKMEYHVKTSEVLVALHGDTVLSVAPAGDSLETNGNIRTFLLKKGVAVVLKKGTWHWVPFPVKDEDAKIMVLFRDGTGSDDLIYKVLCCELNIPEVNL